MALKDDPIFPREALTKLLTSEKSKLKDLDLTKTKLGVLGVQVVGKAGVSGRFVKGRMLGRFVGMEI